MFLYGEGHLFIFSKNFYVKHVPIIVSNLNKLIIVKNKIIFL